MIKLKAWPFIMLGPLLPVLINIKPLTNKHALSF